MSDENEAVFLRRRNAELTFQRDQSWALVTAIQSAMDQYDGELKDRRNGDVAALVAIERIQDAFATFHVAIGVAPAPRDVATIALDDLRSKVTAFASAFNELFYPGNMTGGGAWRAGGNFDQRASDSGGFSGT